MEGFLELKLPIWARVLLTRSVAIVPAIIVTFIDKTELTNLDNILNVFQAVLLPFALIPLLKFVGNADVMGEFAIPKKAYYFAVIFGFSLYVMNFVLLFEDTGDWKWWNWLIVILVSIAYVGL